MKPDTLFLTNASKRSLEKLNALLPDVDDVFLIETALQLTASLFQKSAEGAVIQVKNEKGKVEELRFKVKKETRKKAKPKANA
jgi:hypothetical protein